MANITVASTSFADISNGAHLALFGVDGDGVEVPFTSDGSPNWSLNGTSPAAFVLTPDPDGKGAVVKPASGQVGAINVVASFTIGGNISSVTFPIADTASGETSAGGRVTLL